MRTIAITAAALCVASPALAAGQSAVEQACVLKVAETLPKIAGMKIGKSRTSPAEGPPIASWSRVEIDWSAAGQSATWAYLCAVDSAGNARVQRVAR